MSEGLEDKRLGELDAMMNDQPVINSAGDVVEVPEIDTKAFMKDTLMLGFGVVASKAGEHWAMEEAEADALASAYDAVLTKYFPNAGSMLGVEVTAITVTAMVFLPRIQKDAAIRAEKDVKKIQSSDESLGDAEKPKNDDEFGLDNIKAGE